VRSPPAAARPAALLRDLRRRARAGDVAARWLLRLLTRAEAAAGPRAPDGGTPGGGAAQGDADREEFPDEQRGGDDIPY
jgi:hypothetical protein